MVIRFSRQPTRYWQWSMLPNDRNWPQLGPAPSGSIACRHRLTCVFMPARTFLSKRQTPHEKLADSVYKVIELVVDQHRVVGEGRDNGGRDGCRRSRAMRAGEGGVGGPWRVLGGLSPRAGRRASYRARGLHGPGQLDALLLLLMGARIAQGSDDSRAGSSVGASDACQSAAPAMMVRKNERS